MAIMRRVIFCSLVILGFVTESRADESETKPKKSGDGQVEVYDTERSEEPFLSPEQARATIQAPPGFSVSLFAAEPDVRQPIAMAFDERGRLWVAENYTYEDGKIPEDTQLFDRILIFEDSDNDGRSDGRKVFWDRAPKLTSVEVGFGGVWALCAPHLLFIPDRDGDDVPDGEPVVMLDGWNDRTVAHNIVNGLRWGPDGWLYGRHGILGTSHVRLPDAPADSVTRMNCGLWRFHPERREFEVVVQGTTNPWGHDWDDHGQLFFINVVIGHLWHVIPGARLKRMYGEDFNPYVYELMPQTADHYHWDTREVWSDVRRGVTQSSLSFGGGHAHSGLMLYLGDNWPAEYRNDAFTINFHGRRINRDRLERLGAGYVGKHKPDFLRVGDVWFRGIDLVYGPDGGVYLSDWSDVGECHDQSGIHRSSGRIYKVTHGQPKAPQVKDIAALSDADLVRMQLERNDWWVRQARRVLHERAARGADMSVAWEALRSLFRDTEDVTRKLRAMWCLYVTGGADETWLLDQLRAPDEHLRVWAVKLLVDRGMPSTEVVNALARIARTETSGLVLSFLASALGELPGHQRWSVAEGLVSHESFASDPGLPLMIWYGVEPFVPDQVEPAIELAKNSRIPKVRRFISRRLTEGMARRPEAVDRLVAAIQKCSSDAQADILTGMHDALRGWRKAQAPTTWADVGEDLLVSTNATVRELAQGLGVVFGDARAVRELRREVENETATPAVRRRALNRLVRSRVDAVRPALKQLISDSELGADAVRGLAAYGHSETPGTLLEAYPELHPAAQTAVLDALTSRPAFAGKLLDAVASSKVERGDVPVFQIRRMRTFNDASITARLDELWPHLEPISKEGTENYQKYKNAFTPERLEAADLVRGRQLFTSKCGACHKLFGEGGDSGPDLTGSNRSNLDYLLLNLLDPSGEVAEQYRVSVIVLKDGRVLNGVVGRGTESTITVTTPEEKLVIEKNMIELVRESTLSLMPDGILESMSVNELRHLFAYLTLTSTEPNSSGR